MGLNRGLNMALTGEKKKEYQRKYMREYMRKKRHPEGPGNIKVIQGGRRASPVMAHMHEVQKSLEAGYMPDVVWTSLDADGNPIWE